MVPCTRSEIEEQSYNWQRIAVHKNPRKLRPACRTALAKSVVDMELKNIYSNKDSLDSLRSVCQKLNTFYPLNLRTSVIEEAVRLKKVEDSHQASCMILLHLLTDVRTFVLTTSLNKEEPVCLGEEECNLLLKELENRDQFYFEKIKIKGIIMQRNLISEILRRSPRVHTIESSGPICGEVLASLEEHPCHLRALQLDDASVTDREVIKSLLGSQYDLETLGKMMCEGKSPREIWNIQHLSLEYLSVDSPFITACGAVVLLHYLKNLRSIQYAQTAYKLLLLLEQLTPSETLQFALTSTELWQPTPEVLLSVQRLCPELKHLMIENADPSTPHTLDILSSFTNLESLTLRYVSEDGIISAINSVGANLRSLCISYGSLTSISYEVIKTIHETCPSLQTLEMDNVHTGMKPGTFLLSIKKSVLPELTTLQLSRSVVPQSILERILVGNSCLSSLHLDVSGDSLTEQLLLTLMKNNSFERLTHVYLGAGTITQKGITRLMVLPSLEKLSVAVESFPCFPESDFDSLKKSLAMGNYQCVLENVMQ